MPLFVVNTELKFPPVHLSEPDGLLAMGGDLSPDRLLLAYKSGIFPWYSEDTVLWWSPDPRFVLFPAELKIGKSIRPLLKKNAFAFTTNQAFAEVIRCCKESYRPGQQGTWITDEVEKSFIKMYGLGYAHSAEVWKDNKLVGGLYGIRLGKVFFGESMFSKSPNASRIAFIHFVKQLESEGVELIDCQVYTEYLESFGARMIDRKVFIEMISQLIV